MIKSKKTAKKKPVKQKRIPKVAKLRKAKALKIVKRIKVKKPKPVSNAIKTKIVSVATAKLEKVGAVKKAIGSYEINGWKIKVSTRGITWNNKYVTEVNGTFEGLIHLIENKGNKPITPAHLLANDVTSLVEVLIDRVAEHKTKKFIGKEKKMLKSEGPKLEKRPWCKGCNLCPQGEDSPSCGSMKSNDEIGVFYCNDNRFYEQNWCLNLKRVQNPDKPWQGVASCKLTNEPCPFVKPSIVSGAFYLQRNEQGVHFTKCKTYDGIRTEPEEGIVVDTSGPFIDTDDENNDVEEASAPVKATRKTPKAKKRGSKKSKRK